jgi:putative polymerase
MYSLALFVMNPTDDPKVSIELGMMAAFFLLGRYKCTRRQASGLVWFLVLLALGFGIFEYLAQSTFEQWFNIFNYYVGKGDEEVQRAYVTGTNLAENGMRTADQGRELLPGLLGLHRVGSIFLEPISAGNFTTICIAWILSIRYYRAYGYLLAFLALAIGILADARFAVFSSAAIAVFLITPVWRYRLLVATLPIAAVLFLLVFGAVDRHAVDNSIIGRLHFSGELLGSWTLLNWLGFTDAANRSPDTGYSYLLGNLGVVPCLIVWTLMCLRDEGTEASARFFGAVTLYFSLSLCISGSCLSIKTAALLWLLYGVLQNSEDPDLSTS